MKRLLSLFMFCSLLLPATVPSVAADEVIDVLVLQLKNGELHTFVLANRPSVKFYNSSLLVQSPELQADYKDVARFYFDNAENVVGIRSAQLAPGQLVLTYVDGNTVRVQGVGRQAFVGVYGTDGKVYQPEIDRADAEVLIHLNTLQRGVYIIRINQQSYKITKR